MNIQTAINAAFIACVIILAIIHHDIQKELRTMSKALDDLTAAVSGVQASVATVQAYVADLQTGQGTPDSALTPITDQLTAVKATLDGLTAPKA